MFDIGLWEFVAMGFIALLVFGPDKLPKVAADAARMIRELRSMATGARRELTEALGPELNDLQEQKDLQSLNPRTFVKRNFLDVLDDDDDTETGPATPTQRAPTEPAADEPRPASPQGYDADTT